MATFFSSLTRGVKFDTERFLDDAVRLRVIREGRPPPPAGAHHVNRTQDPTMKDPTDKTTTPKRRRQFKEEVEEDGVPIFKRRVGDQEEVVNEKVTRKKKEKTVKQVEEEKLHLLRKSHSIYVQGEGVPSPIQEFGSIQGMTREMMENIQSAGYELPTAVQMQCIPVMMGGHELLASAPTGSGKSAAFLIPSILLLQGRSKHQGKEINGPRAVVVSPTRELAGQIYRECIRLSQGSPLVVLNLADKSNQKNPQNCDILISTPNRLVYTIKDSKIKLSSVHLLVVDECDNLFEEGFQNQLGYIYTSCDSPLVKRAFFSATCSHSVDEFCRSHLDSHISIAIGAKNSAVDQIDQKLVFVGDEAGKLVEIRKMMRLGVQGPLLIFVQSQERAEELYTELVMGSILKCGVIHSGKSQAHRSRTIQDFRVGGIFILICTNLLSRGMDFPAVRTVINYDMPANHISYIHSVGRTGRGGRTGTAVTFFTEVDKINLGRIAQVLKNSGFPVPPFLFKLKRVRKGEERVPKRRHISRRAVELRKEKIKMKRWRGKAGQKSATKSQKAPNKSTKKKSSKS